MTAPSSLDPLLAFFQKTLGHELPNQLIAMTGLARLLELEVGDRLGQARDYLERLAAAGQHCHGLVKELAEIIRLARQPAAAASLAEVVRDTLETLRANQPVPPLRLSFAEDALTAFVPEAGLRLAVRHVLRLTGPAARAVRSRRGDGRVILEITAAGPLALPAAQLFEPCADPHLAAAAAVLACHGGTIAVQSTEAETSIALVLPPVGGPGGEVA